MPSFSFSSRDKLDSCHPDLKRLFNEVIKHYDCTILCGHRNEFDQNLAFQSGTSKVKWPDSKHNSSPSLAVDVAPYPINWQDVAKFYDFANYVKFVAEFLQVKVIWGGDFRSIIDMPHWQIHD